MSVLSLIPPRKKLGLSNWELSEGITPKKQEGFKAQFSAILWPNTPWLALATIASAGLSLLGASQSASASTQAAGTQAQSQAEQLQYLQEINAMPQMYKEQALQKLGGLYGLPGMGGANGGAPGDGNNEFIQGLMDNPLYQNLVQQGEEGALRYGSATGGLRSGNTIEALANVNMGALQSVYNQQVSGLTGLAGLNQPSMAPLIAQTIGDIGTTQAQGQIGAAQAWQTGMGNAANIGLQGAGLWYENRPESGGII